MKRSAFLITNMVTMNGSGKFYETFEIEHDNGSVLNDLSREDLEDLKNQIEDYLKLTFDAYSRLPRIHHASERERTEEEEPAPEPEGGEA